MLSECRRGGSKLSVETCAKRAAVSYVACARADADAERVFELQTCDRRVAAMRGGLRTRRLPPLTHQRRARRLRIARGRSRECRLACRRADPKPQRCRQKCRT